MTILDAVSAELGHLDAVESPEGQRALVLAAAMDDRAGVVNLGATDKRLGELLGEIREKFTPRESNRLELIRGGSDARTSGA